MTTDLLKTELTAEQKSHITGILSLGCDRETAANLTCQSTDEFARALRQDPAFAAEVRRTEASVEFAHMRKIHKASEDKGNWRISIWWLERRSPERFAARSPGAVTTRHLKAFLDFFGECLASDVRNPEDRERVEVRLKQLAALCCQLDDDLWENPLGMEDLRPDLNFSSVSDSHPLAGRTGDGAAELSDITPR